MSLLMKGETSQQGAHKESEPTLRELAEELSLELSPEPAAVARGAPIGKTTGSAGARQQDAANLFVAMDAYASSRKRRAVVLSMTALLLLAGGGAYAYLAMDEPRLRVPAQSPLQPLPGTPSVPQAGNQAVTERVSAPVEVAQPELFHRPIPVPRTPPAEKAGTLPEAEPGSAQAAAEKAIKVQRGGQSEINPDLAAAYLSLQEGRLESAKMLYQRLLQQEPRNVDALLGMAAVAAQSKQVSEAGVLYFRALEVEPGNTFAQAGLLNLLGGSDPLGSEARLKQLLAEKPAGFLHFALGNLYATQGRWTEAQQAYFQAYHLESDHSGHAFNLAVSLEQIGQPRPARTYYQRALDLSPQRGAGFERASAEARIAHLRHLAD